MDKDVLKGNWSQIKGKLKENFGRLTDDDLTRSEGSLDVLVGRLQEQYGWTKDEVKSKLKELGLM